MQLRKRIFIFIALVLVPFVSFGEVNQKNGGFYITYTDLLVSGGDHDLAITRTYNSKSKNKGWFGIGWGSPFETKIAVSGDGSIFILENGSGAQRRFVSKEIHSIDDSIKKIFEAAKAKKDFISESFIKKLTAEFKINSELRLKYFKKYNIESKIADGTVLSSEDIEPQTLVKDKDGYRRNFQDGRIEFFDLHGNLVKIKDKFDYTVDVDYKDGLPFTIRNSQGTQIVLEWNAKKTVKAATSTGDKKVNYIYNEKDDLVESTDVNGLHYKYTYDPYHNLTAINYSDKTSLLVRYNKESSVVETTERNKEVVSYKYEKNPKNHLNFWTVVSKKLNNNRSSVSRFEYELKSKLDGQLYTYRTLTEIFGIKTETIYSENNGLPLKITQGENITTFEYNEQGKLLKKASKDSTLQYEYDPKTNKISKFTNGEEWMSFNYDKRGNLVKAEKNDGRVIQINYNRLGEVVLLNDQNKNDIKSQRTFSLKYSPTGKPTTIDLSRIGTVQVSYDGYGEVKGLESSGGEPTALAVFEAFQSIVDLLRPAGINLSI